MFFQTNTITPYDPNVKAIIAFLSQLRTPAGGGVKINNSTVNTALQNHPDYPSLLCISDSLTKWNISNAAGSIDPEQIEALPVPFLAYTHNREYPLAVVTKVNGNEVAFYSKNYYKPIRSSIAAFIKTWGGIYLIAEATEHSGEKDYVPHKRKAIFNRLLPAALLTLLFSLSFYSLYNSINTNSGYLAAGAFSIYLQFFILLAGVVVSSLLLWYEIDKNNPILKKVCTGIAKGNCNAILSGKKSKVFHWLSWSELGFFYFTGGALLLIFSGALFNKALAINGILNLLALPYIVFSVYYQWRVARQWCVLCLAVQALLLAGGINVLTANFIGAFSTITAAYWSKALLIYLLPVLLWYANKPFLLRLQEAKNTKREYLRIKFNQEIFETLLKNQKTVTMPVDGLGIDLLGNKIKYNEN